MNLALFVDAEHERAVRRIETQADDVTDFLDEQRVARQLERLTPVRLEAERPPDPSDRAVTQIDLLREGACRPVRGVGRFRFQCLHDQALHVVVRNAPGGTRPWLIEQSVQALGEKPPAPANSLPRDPQLRRDRRRGPTARAPHNDPCALRQSLRGRATTCPLFEPCPLAGADDHADRADALVSPFVPPCTRCTRGTRILFQNSDPGH